jgi:hypothetical protein
VVIGFEFFHGIDELLVILTDDHVLLVLFAALFVFIVNTAHDHLSTFILRFRRRLAVMRRSAVTSGTMYQLFVVMMLLLLMTVMISASRG